MEKKLDNTTVSVSLPIAVSSIRSNFELWRKGEINDGAFSWHLQNNLLLIEKELGWSFKGMVADSTPLIPDNIKPLEESN